jgi:diguanylate cyclase (GGDEF)-like protein/PAS domain S-box-containing protein
MPPEDGKEAMSKKPTYEELEEKIRKLEKEVTTADSHRSQTYQDQQFLQILIDTIPSPIFYKCNNGIYRHCNEAFSNKILGISSDMIVNKSLFDLPDQIPPELAKIYAEKDQHLLDNPGTQTYKGKVKCSDDEIRTYQFYKSTILNESGRVAGLVGVMLDITNLEESSTRLEEQNNKLESLSYIDSLSSLYNRRKFEAVFPKLLETPGKDRLLNIAIIDIDYFKSYNDIYGHPKGDQAIKCIADVIKQNLRRPEDYAFRVGGEEFCLLFWSHDEEGAISIAEAIRNDVQKLAIEHIYNEGEKVVTISTGILSINGSRTDKESLYEEADKLLYKAKHAGRNNVKHRLN